MKVQTRRLAMTAMVALCAAAAFAGAARAVECDHQRVPAVGVAASRESRQHVLARRRMCELPGGQLIAVVDVEHRGLINSAPDRRRLEGA